MERSEKIIVNVSSYERIDSLILSLESIYDQCDIINVCLNNHYGDIPSYLLDPKINLTFTDNSKGDAFKFLNLINSDGYYFTIDDDLIYPKNYVEYMISKCKEYNDNTIITLHGRVFNSLPIKSYYNSKCQIHHYNSTVKNDVNVQYGGTGVMCFNTNLFKLDLSYFKYPNMADIWIGNFAKKNNIPIICVNHDSSFIQTIPQKSTIYNTEKGRDIVQTNVVNSEYGHELSIIIPTYNTPKYLRECLDSVSQSIKDINCEVLVGIDNCEHTRQFIKNNEFDYRIRFFYFENNVGPYVIKNSLSKISRSDSILFFDSDDIMKDTMVSDIIDKQNNFEFVKPMYSNFNSVIRNIKVNEVKTGQYGEGVFSIKKDLFLHMNGFEGWRCAADSDFMKRLYKNNRKFSYTDEVLFYRRKHSSNLTTAPETGFMSKLRAGYASITKNKKDFGPLPNIITENFTEIYPNNYTLIGDYGTSFINDTIDREKSEVISRLTLKRQTLKPIIQEVRESVPEKKEYITVDNTGVINTIFTRKSNPEVSQQPIQVQTNNRQPVRNSQVQKDIINEKRKLLSQSQQKVTPDGFKQKKTYNKGDMTRRGGSFNF